MLTDIGFLGDHAESRPSRLASPQASATPSKLAPRTTPSIRLEGHSPPSWASSHHPCQGWPFLPQQALSGIKQERGSSPPPIVGHHQHLPDLLSLPHPLNRLPKIPSEEELEYDCEEGIGEEEEGIEVERAFVIFYAGNQMGILCICCCWCFVLSVEICRWTYRMEALLMDPYPPRKRRGGFFSQRYWKKMKWMPQKHFNQTHLTISFRQSNRNLHRYIVDIMNNVLCWKVWTTMFNI